MKQIILDYSKWRCGGDDTDMPNVLGKGETALLNNEGFMCCLSQQIRQEIEIDESLILDAGTPSWLRKEIPILTKTLNSGSILNSDFSHRAMSINDDQYTTPSEKIAKLTTLFAEHDRELVVINMPVDGK